jgi:hypothetical protein
LSQFDQSFYRLSTILFLSLSFPWYIQQALHVQLKKSEPTWVWDKKVPARSCIATTMFAVLAGLVVNSFSTFALIAIAVADSSPALDLNPRISFSLFRRIDP